MSSSSSSQKRKVLEPPGEKVIVARTLSSSSSHADEEKILETKLEEIHGVFRLLGSKWDRVLLSDSPYPRASTDHSVLEGTSGEALLNALFDKYLKGWFEAQQFPAVTVPPKAPPLQCCRDCASLRKTLGSTAAPATEFYRMNGCPGNHPYERSCITWQMLDACCTYELLQNQTDKSRWLCYHRERSVTDKERGELLKMQGRAKDCGLCRMIGTRNKHAFGMSEALVQRMIGPMTPGGTIRPAPIFRESDLPMLKQYCKPFQLLDIDGYRASDVRLWDPDKQEFIKLGRDVQDSIVVPRAYRDRLPYEGMMKAWLVNANTTRTGLRFDDEPLVHDERHSDFSFAWMISPLE